MSQHVQKATIPGPKAKISQKIHVLPANKHLKKSEKKSVSPYC